MSPNEYQELALRTESPFKSNADIGEDYQILRSAVERIGTLADSLKRTVFYNATGVPVSAPDRRLHAILGIVSELPELMDVTANFKEELGDILWYIALFADASELSLQEIMEKNIAKLSIRYPNKFSEIDAKNRDVSAEMKALGLESRGE